MKYILLIFLISNAVTISNLIRDKSILFARSTINIVINYLLPASIIHYSYFYIINNYCTNITISVYYSTVFNFKKIGFFLMFKYTSSLYNDSFLKKKLISFFFSCLLLRRINFVPLFFSYLLLPRGINKFDKLVVSAMLFVYNKLKEIIINEINTAVFNKVEKITSHYTELIIIRLYGFLNSKITNHFHINLVRLSVNHHYYLKPIILCSTILCLFCSYLIYTISCHYLLLYVILCGVAITFFILLYYCNSTVVFLYNRHPLIGTVIIFLCVATILSIIIVLIKIVSLSFCNSIKRLIKYIKVRMETEGPGQPSGSQGPSGSSSSGGGSNPPGGGPNPPNKKYVWAAEQSTSGQKLDKRSRSRRMDELRTQDAQQKWQKLGALKQRWDLEDSYIRSEGDQIRSMEGGQSGPLWREFNQRISAVYEERQRVFDQLKKEAYIKVKD